jgi:hypothetical protein
MRKRIGPIYPPQPAPAQPLAVDYASRKLLPVPRRRRPLPIWTRRLLVSAACLAGLSVLWMVLWVIEFVVNFRPG